MMHDQEKIKSTQECFLENNLSNGKKKFVFHVVFL